MGNVKDGFFKNPLGNGNHFYSVKGDRALVIWANEGIRSINHTWHFGFDGEEVEEIEEMEFIQEMQKCAKEWEQYLTGGK